MANLVLITNLCLRRRGKLGIEPLPGIQGVINCKKAKSGADPGNLEKKHSAQIRQSGVDQSLSGTEELIREKANPLLEKRRK